MDRNSARTIIESTLTQSFDESRFLNLSVNLLEGINRDKAFSWVSGNYIRDAFKAHVRKYRRLGTYTDPDGRKLDLLIVHLRNPWALERSRGTQRNFVAEYLKQRGEKDAALIAYHVDDLSEWRFSYVRMQYREEVTDSGRVKVKEDFTPARRYSFLVGQHEPSHTAQQQLIPLLEEADTPSLEEIERAFSVERVTKEFYTDYRALFESVNETLEGIVQQDERVRDEFVRKSIDPANFAKKLLGQIVFLYFLQKKGWLGVGRDESGDYLPWGQGPKNFLRRLYEQDCTPYTNCFDEILEPLFYEALASERPDDVYTRFKCRIPFLNGGLFEPLNDYNWREVDIKLPNALIGRVLDAFDRYNFTVREDDPLDQEVAVDPEMLGKVFENLLPENLRKGKGSYYTPRNVVHFMCQESLINYLDAAVNRGEVSLATEAKQQRLIVLGGEQLEFKRTGRVLQVSRADLEEFIRKGEFSQEMDAAKEAGTKSYTYRVPEAIRSQAKALDGALASIKVCDPAVGSGAFLVGMMHEIVKARSILTTYLGDPSSRSPYELKRQCIHNSLYGVDIDPGAVEITKLRLWLSLVVDEDEYSSIHPLPNLDYKVMQGNSLFEDFHGIDLSFGQQEDEASFLRKDRGIADRVQKLHESQAAFFDAMHHKEKRQLRTAIEDSILDVFSYAVERRNTPFYSDKAYYEREALKLPAEAREAYITEKLATLKDQYAFDPKALESELRELTHGNVPRGFFPWRLYFADVFQNRGGFDVVIANPPYVRQELIRDQKPQLKATYPDVYHGVADLYVYFYRRAFDIASPNGTVTFISSNKYFRAGYGKTLRTFLREKAELNLIIDFGDLPIFDATTYPSVVIATNCVPDLKHHTARVVNVRDMEKLDSLPDFLAEVGWKQPQRSLLKDGWALEHADVLALVEKLKASGTPLGEYVEGRVFRGIVTGCNEAFVIDQATRDHLNAEDPRSAEIIKPWLRGKDVKRWRVEWNTLYVLFTRRGIEIENYPAVLEHLEQYRERLEPRPPDWDTSKHGHWRGRKTGSYKWYEIQDAIDYYDQFEKPKIIYPDISLQPQFTYETTGSYLVNTLYFIPSPRVELLGLLNSAVVHFFVHFLTASIQNSYLRFFSQYVAQIPVPMEAEGASELREITERLLALGSTHSQKLQLESELDRFVFGMYCMSTKEIELVSKTLEAPGLASGER